MGRLVPHARWPRRGRGRRGAAAARPRPGLHRPRRRLRAAVVVPVVLVTTAGRGWRRCWSGRSARCGGWCAAARPPRVADRPADRRRLRRPGPGAHRSVHGARACCRTSRSSPPLARYRRLQTTYPVALAGGVVVVQHRHTPGAPQHLRFPRPRPPHLPAAAVVDPHRQGRAVLPARQVPDPAAPPRAAPTCGARSRSGRCSASTASGARSCACRSRSRRIASTAPS